MTMQVDEQQLEELSEKVSRYAERKPSPMFEMFITLLSITFAIMLLLFDNMMMISVQNDNGDFYLNLVQIMSQDMWAGVFFLAGIFKALGLLLQKDALRIIGLLMSAAIYAIIALSLYSSFPNFGSIIFTYLCLFAAYSISIVKYTGIRNR